MLPPTGMAGARVARWPHPLWQLLPLRRARRRPRRRCRRGRTIRPRSRNAPWTRYRRIYRAGGAWEGPRYRPARGERFWGRFWPGARHRARRSARRCPGLAAAPASGYRQHAARRPALPMLPPPWPRCRPRCRPAGRGGATMPPGWRGRAGPGAAMPPQAGPGEDQDTAPPGVALLPPARGHDAARHGRPARDLHRQVCAAYCAAKRFHARMFRAKSHVEGEQ